MHNILYFEKFIEGCLYGTFEGFSSKTFNSGYMVSVPEYEKVGDWRNLSWLQYMETQYNIINTAAAKGENFCFGAWLDKNSQVYFDLSENIPNLETAIEVGRLRGQIAIWDCKNSCEIRL